MQDRGKLNLNIVLWVAALAAFQAVLFWLLARQYGFDRETIRLFLLVSAGVHVLLMCTLFVFRFAFYNLVSGEPVNRVNLPNLLTMTRISATPTILFLLFLNQSHPVLVPLVLYTAGAFLTDFLDGNISRRTKQVTKIGAYLDSMSDYGVLISVSVAYLYFHLISTVFFLLVLVRLCTQWIGAAILTILAKKWAEHKSSLLGKASVFIIMTVYGLALLKLIPDTGDVVRTWFRYVEAAAAVVIVISLLEKLGVLVVDIRAARRESTSADQG